MNGCRSITGPASKRFRISPRNGCGPTITTARTWPWAVSPQSSIWRWLHNRSTSLVSGNWGDYPPPPGPARNRPLTSQHSCRRTVKKVDTDQNATTHFLARKKMTECVGRIDQAARLRKWSCLILYRVMTIPSRMNYGLKVLENITTARYLPEKT